MVSQYAQYYTVFGADPDPTCQYTWMVNVWYDSTGAATFISGAPCIGIPGFYRDYVEPAGIVDVSTLPANVQNWIGSFAYSNFDAKNVTYG